MKTPTDKEKQAVIEDYTKSLIHLKKLGLIQLVDGGTCVRPTDLGMAFIQAEQKLDEYNLAHPQKEV